MNHRFALSMHLNALAVQRNGHVVCAGLDLTLAPGDAVVLRGENGTGKTSALRTIAGFAEPADGSVGFSSNDAETIDLAEARALHLHWLGGEDGIADRLTIEENFRFWGGLLAPAEYHVDTETVLSKIGLKGRSTHLAGALSTGQRRRLGLGRLLAAPRAVWLLDEPMSGLDTGGRELVLATVAHHRAGGGIVVMATHDEGLPNAPTLRLSPAIMESAS